MELAHTTKRNNSVQNEKKTERGLTLYHLKNRCATKWLLKLSSKKSYTDGHLDNGV